LASRRKPAGQIYEVVREGEAVTAQGGILVSETNALISHSLLLFKPEVLEENQRDFAT
jgi:hypothetical protein